MTTIPAPEEETAAGSSAAAAAAPAVGGLQIHETRLAVVAAAEAAQREEAGQIGSGDTLPGIIPLPKDESQPLPEALRSELTQGETVSLLLAVQFQDDVYDHLTGANLQHLARSMLVVRTSPGETIIRRGESASFFAIILKGEFTAVVSKDYSVPLKTGAMIGEMAFFEGGVRSADIVCAKRGILAVISYDDMDHRVDDRDLQVKLVTLLARSSLRKMRATLDDHKAAVAHIPRRRRSLEPGEKITLSPSASEHLDDQTGFKSSDASASKEDENAPEEDTLADLRDDPRFRSLLKSPSFHEGETASIRQRRRSSITAGDIANARAQALQARGSPRVARRELQEARRGSTSRGPSTSKFIVETLFKTKIASQRAMMEQKSDGVASVTQPMLTEPDDNSAKQEASSLNGDADTQYVVKNLRRRNAQLKEHALGMQLAIDKLENQLQAANKRLDEERERSGAFLDKLGAERKAKQQVQKKLASVMESLEATNAELDTESVGNNDVLGELPLSPPGSNSIQAGFPDTFGGGVQGSNSRLIGKRRSMAAALESSRRPLNSNALSARRGFDRRPSLGRMDSSEQLRMLISRAPFSPRSSITSASPAKGAPMHHRRAGSGAPPVMSSLHSNGIQATMQHARDSANAASKQQEEAANEHVLAGLPAGMPVGLHNADQWHAAAQATADFWDYERYRMQERLRRMVLVRMNMSGDIKRYQTLLKALSISSFVKNFRVRRHIKGLYRSLATIVTQLQLDQSSIPDSMELYLKSDSPTERTGAVFDEEALRDMLKRHRSELTANPSSTRTVIQLFHELTFVFKERIEYLRASAAHWQTTSAAFVNRALEMTEQRIAYEQQIREMKEELDMMRSSWEDREDQFHADLDKAKMVSWRDQQGLGHRARQARLIEAEMKQLRAAVVELRAEKERLVRDAQSLKQHNRMFEARTAFFQQHFAAVESGSYQAPLANVNDEELQELDSDQSPRQAWQLASSDRPSRKTKKNQSQAGSFDLRRLVSTYAARTKSGSRRNPGSRRITSVMGRKPRVRKNGKPNSPKRRLPRIKNSNQASSGSTPDSSRRPDNIPSTRAHVAEHGGFILAGGSELQSLAHQVHASRSSSRASNRIASPPVPEPRVIDVEHDREQAGGGGFSPIAHLQEEADSRGRWNNWGSTL